MAGASAGPPRSALSSPKRRSSARPSRHISRTVELSGFLESSRPISSLTSEAERARDELTFIRLKSALRTVSTRFFTALEPRFLGMVQRWVECQMP